MNIYSVNVLTTEIKLMMTSAAKETVVLVTRVKSRKRTKRRKVKSTNTL